MPVPFSCGLHLPPLLQARVDQFGTCPPPARLTSHTCALPLPSGLQRWPLSASAPCLSSQSIPQNLAPLASTLQHVPSVRVSWSASTPPLLVVSQSSSWLYVSHTSRLPGKREASPSSQSLPPKATAREPSLSRSACAPRISSGQLRRFSLGAENGSHLANTNRQPRASAPACPGLHSPCGWV